MENEQSAVNKFLGNSDETMFPQEENIFTVEQNESPEDENEPEEKPLPFHKDPKILKFIEKEIARRTPEKEVKTETPKEINEFQEVVDSFTTIIGNDTPEKVQALNALKTALTNLDEKAVRRAEAKIQEIQNEEFLAEQEAEEELSNALEDIEENFDVDITSNTQSAKKMRNDFLGFVEKIAPKDRQGNIIDYPDMASAWETFSSMRQSTKQPSRAKELASKSLSRSSESVPAQQERVDWNKVDSLLDGLK